MSDYEKIIIAACMALLGCGSVLHNKGNKLLVESKLWN